MRGAVLILLALLALPACAGAQTVPASPPFTIEREYRFAAIFPGAPQATDVSLALSDGTSFAARQFRFEQDANAHRVTVVVLPQGPAIDRRLVERAAETLRRKGEVRFQADDDYDPGLPGRQLNIFQSNGRQLRASVYMWDHRLYITEADGVPGAASLLQFEQSITLLNEDGTEVNLGF
jgi:hypothetical protein